MRAVDLFCCAGGAAVGLHRAGFSLIDGYGHALSKLEQREQSEDSALRRYLRGRRLTIESSIASETLAGNDFKLACERTALAEITALECELARAASGGATRKDGGAT